jgi:hypothetical protein
MMTVSAFGAACADGVEELDAPHARHLEVADDDVVVRVRQLVSAAAPSSAVRTMYPSMPEEVGEDVADELLVVDDEDARALVVPDGARFYPASRSADSSPS